MEHSKNNNRNRTNVIVTRSTSTPTKLRKPTKCTVIGGWKTMTIYRAAFNYVHAIGSSPQQLPCIAPSHHS